MNAKTLTQLAELFGLVQRTMHKHSHLDGFPEPLNRGEVYDRIYSTSAVIDWMLKNNKKIDLSEFASLSDIAKMDIDGMRHYETLKKYAREDSLFPRHVDILGLRKYIIDEVSYYLLNKKRLKNKEKMSDEKTAIEFSNPSHQIMFLSGRYDSAERKKEYEVIRSRAASKRRYTAKIKQVVSLSNDWSV